MDNAISQSLGNVRPPTRQENNNPVSAQIRTQPIPIPHNNNVFSQRSKDLFSNQRVHLLKSIEMGQLVTKHREKYIENLNNKIHREWNDAGTSSLEDIKNLAEARIAHQNNLNMLNQDIQEYGNPFDDNSFDSGLPKKTIYFLRKHSQSTERGIFQLDIDTPKEH